MYVSLYVYESVNAFFVFSYFLKRNIQQQQQQQNDSNSKSFVQ